MNRTLRARISRSDDALIDGALQSHDIGKIADLLDQAIARASSGRHATSIQSAPIRR